MSVQQRQAPKAISSLLDVMEEIEEKTVYCKKENYKKIVNRLGQIKRIW